MAREQDRFSDPNWNCYEERPARRREVSPLPPLYRELVEQLFAASWQRMVLLASTMEYREYYEMPLPSPERDHDIITLEAMLACVDLNQPEQTSLSEAEINSIQQEQTGET